MTGPLVTVSRALMFGLTNVAQRNILPNGAVAAMERVQKMVDRHKDQAARRDYMRRFMWAKRHAENPLCPWCGLRKADHIGAKTWEDCQAAFQRSDTSNAQESSSSSRPD